MLAVARERLAERQRESGGEAAPAKEAALV